MPDLTLTPREESVRHADPTGILHLRRRAFTLVEILIVLGIIILMAAAAVPAFRFIVGARSLDGAHNIASAMVARARTQALVDHRGTGVFFYLDPAADRTTMTLVQLEGEALPDPDFIEYEGWANGQAASPPAPLPPPAITYYDPADPQHRGPSFVQVLNPVKPVNTESHERHPRTATTMVSRNSRWSKPNTM